MSRNRGRAPEFQRYGQFGGTLPYGPAAEGAGPWRRDFVPGVDWAGEVRRSEPCVLAIGRAGTSGVSAAVQYSSWGAHIAQSRRV